MFNNATFVDKEQIKNLKKIDNWLNENKYSYDEETFLSVRELITNILERGYYYESEAEVLNMIANEYNQWKKQNK